jgi:hypothetical protein
VIRFLADADLDYAIDSGCKRREPAIDFLSANDANLEGVPDPTVLALAAEQDRILVSTISKPCRDTLASSSVQEVPAPASFW